MTASAVATVLNMSPSGGRSECPLTTAHAQVSMWSGEWRGWSRRRYLAVRGRHHSRVAGRAVNDVLVLDEVLHEGVPGRGLPVMQDERAPKLRRQSRLVGGLDWSVV